MKTIDMVNRTCPSCGGSNVRFSLEEHEFPYGAPGPDQVQLKTHAIVLSCLDERCGVQATDWQTETITDTAVKIYKEEEGEELRDREVIRQLLWLLPHCQKGLCLQPATRTASYLRDGVPVASWDSCDAHGTDPAKDFEHADLIRAALKKVGGELT